VIALQDQVMRHGIGQGYQFTFGLRVRAPKHENQWHFSLRKCLYQTVRENLPAPIGVTGWQSVLYRQGRVEQQNPLLNPSVQLAI
jgi:hypothetical protein